MVFHCIKAFLTTEEDRETPYAEKTKYMGDVTLQTLVTDSTLPGLLLSQGLSTKVLIISYQL